MEPREHIYSGQKTEIERRTYVMAFGLPPAENYISEGGPATYAIRMINLRGTGNF